MTRAEAEILTVDDLAKLFSCDKETAAARLTTGDLPGVKVGRGWIIPRQALFERLNEKAREESAIRRAHHAFTVDEPQLIGSEIEAKPERLSLEAPVVLLNEITSRKRGRKRRIPPLLPVLPK
jgi:excisionase family DNA binding protein